LIEIATLAADGLRNFRVRPGLAGGVASLKVIASVPLSAAVGPGALLGFAGSGLLEMPFDPELHAERIAAQRATLVFRAIAVPFIAGRLSGR
jgi:hypothetical protein